VIVIIFSEFKNDNRTISSMYNIIANYFGRLTKYLFNDGRFIIEAIHCGSWIYDLSHVLPRPGVGRVRKLWMESYRLKLSKLELEDEIRKLKMELQYIQVLYFKTFLYSLR